MSARARLAAGSVLLLVAAALLAGCGSSSDTSTTAADTASTATTTTIEGDLQAKLDDATQSCKDAAGKIANATLQSAALSACDQLSSSLAQEIASAADQAKGNLSQALDNLAADCRKRAQSLSVGQGVVGSFCDALSASSGSVTTGG